MASRELYRLNARGDHRQRRPNACPATVADPAHHHLGRYAEAADCYRILIEIDHVDVRDIRSKIEGRSTAVEPATSS